MNSISLTKPLLTLREAAALTGIGINRLRELSSRPRCPFVLFVGNKRMFKRDKLLQFLMDSYSI